jgi:hypothetical protein
LQRAASWRILLAVRRSLGVLAISGLVAAVVIGVRQTSIAHEATTAGAHASGLTSTQVSRGSLLPLRPLALPRFPPPLIPGAPNPRGSGRGTRCLISTISTCSFAPCLQFVSAAPSPAGASPAGLLAGPLSSVVGQPSRRGPDTAPPRSGTRSCDRHPSAAGVLIPLAVR